MDFRRKNWAAAFKMVGTNLFILLALLAATELVFRATGIGSRNGTNDRDPVLHHEHQRGTSSWFVYKKGEMTDHLVVYDKNGFRASEKTAQRSARSRTLVMANF